MAPIKSVLGVITSPIFVSVVTALVTVYFTYRVHSRWVRVRNLAGLLSEVSINQEMATDYPSILIDLIEHRENRVQRDFPLHKLQTSAFDSFKNSGMLLSLSPEHRKLIVTHYVIVEAVNLEIGHREGSINSVFPNSGWGSVENERWDSYNKFMLTRERSVLVQLLNLIPYDIAEELLEESDSDFLNLLNAEGSPDQYESDYDFGSIEEILRAEIKQHRFLSNFVNSY